MRINANKQGFTLVEVMAATLISVMVISGIVTCFIGGLRLWKFQYTKASTMNKAYIGMSKMLNDIRGAYWFQLGTFSGATFTGLTEGTPQLASAIKIMRSPATNDWFLYYYSATSNTIYRAEYPGTASNTLILQNIASSAIFQNEIYTNSTTLVSGHTNQTGLISINLQFGLPNGTNSLIFGIGGTNTPGTNIPGTIIYQTRVSACTRKV